MSHPLLDFLYKTIFTGLSNCEFYYVYFNNQITDNNTIKHEKILKKIKLKLSMTLLTTDILYFE